MEYRYSTIVDQSTYETEGLCEGIPLRLHHSQESEDLGAIKAQEDWATLVGPAEFIKASLGPKFNFLSVAFPETIPDCMEVLAYFNEFIFLHDDVVEAVDQAKGDEQNDEALEACRAAAEEMAFRRKTSRQHMISKASQKMLAMDPGVAKTTLALWTEWFDKGAGRRNHNRFQTLGEYLEYRILDVGKMYLTGVMIFAMGLNILDDEQELLSQLCRPAWIALGLTNDLYSLWKERRAAAEMGETHVSNAVCVVMREHSISEDMAYELCRQKIRESVAAYAENMRWTVAQTDELSRDVRAFVEGIQYIISGNLVWSRGVPRYNPDTTYNARQLHWMANGTPKTVSEGKQEAGEKQEGTCLLCRLLRTASEALWVLYRYISSRGAS
ncbi:Fusicoccadiene synthase [Madurella mycetomatis]|uniref:Fusicoccadiene synthase n=1 Tax=Madurella mycetomatis TaxID=100816 RepID=A0A175VQQ0_9PEZI|nr:Fusicoccadiene synthase [Madurella mycetomatis]